MKRPLRLLTMSGAFGLVWSVTFFSLMGAPMKDETKEKSSISAEELRSALDKKVSLEIIEQPLNLAISVIGEQTKVNFVLDETTLANYGIDAESIPISYKAKDVKLRTALRTILMPHNLNFAVIGETVVVSTSNVLLQRQIHQRVSVDVEKISLREALQQLSKQTATNLVLDPRNEEQAKALVTLQVEEVPLTTAVRLMSIMADLRMVQVGNVLFVTTKETAGEMRTDPTLNPLQNPNFFGNPFNPNGVAPGIGFNPVVPGLQFNGAIGGALGLQGGFGARAQFGGFPGGR